MHISNSAFAQIISSLLFETEIPRYFQHPHPTNFISIDF